jgi:ABC-2 type transport system ATP-binding protein
MLKLIKLFKDKGKTIVITTHQLEDFEGLCEYLVILLQGKILLSRRVKELKSSLLNVYKKHVKE